MKVVDVDAVCRIVKPKNKDAIIVVDNTFLTPYFQVRLNTLTKFFQSYWGSQKCIKEKDMRNSEFF